MIEKGNNLSYEISLIKQYNRYGLIDISDHAIQRINERGFKPMTIMNCISDRNTTIIQHHEPYSYHGNSDELFVLYGKIIYNKKPQPVHIVVAKNMKTESKKYSIVTCYIPDKQLFYAHGRKLRRN